MPSVISGPAVLLAAIEPAPRRLVERAVLLWSGLTLAGIAIVAGFVIWHLVRRGRLLRDRLGPPKIVEWPELPARPDALETVTEPGPAPRPLRKTDRP